MDVFTVQYLIWAIALGAISAVSLPMGSLVGLLTTPRAGLISVLAAFGAGALIAALSVELVAPTVFALEHATGNPGHGDPNTDFYALVLGAAAGGLLFSVLDRLVNAQGGFLRRTSATIGYLTARKRDRQVEMLEELAAFPLLKGLPPEHVNALVSRIRPVRYAPGEVLAREGEPATGILFVTGGRVEAMTPGGLQTEFGPGSVLGVIPLVMDRPQVALATAREAVSAYLLSPADFRRLRELSHEFDAAARALTDERLHLIEDLLAERQEVATHWLRQARQALKTGAEMPDELALRRAAKEHEGAPLAIWLGILLDGIPESFVIGAGLLTVLQVQMPLPATFGFAEAVPYTLIAGLFLSNFPEALASSANMRLQGFEARRIFLLWFSLLVITALGAGAGFLLADSLTHTWVVFVEGLAAGAMLTMIAAAMIPEAVHMGKAGAVGLSTLAGFLAAISFTLLG